MYSTFRPPKLSGCQSFALSSVHRNSSGYQMYPQLCELRMTTGDQKRQGSPLLGVFERGAHCWEFIGPPLSPKRVAAAMFSLASHHLWWGRGLTLLCVYFGVKPGVAALTVQCHFCFLFPSFSKIKIVSVCLLNSLSCFLILQCKQQ